ncbi:MAG: DEAD/DEAH box helicase family protein [Candidatus Xenobiia bacterium LiM19]
MNLWLDGIPEMKVAVYLADDAAPERATNSGSVMHYITGYVSADIQLCSILLFASVILFRQSGCGSLLFIAHRENLLEQARMAFGAILSNAGFGSIYGGGRDLPEQRDALFAMVQTLGRPENLERFSRDEFEYIVIDEFHHSMADSYRRILEHFTPSFLLGLTATPERLDGRDVLSLCDYNVACEVRLLDAVDRGWLSPFQYFAVYDDTDYQDITWRSTHYDEEELSAALSKDNRSDAVAENLRRYLPSAGKTRKDIGI